MKIFLKEHTRKDGYFIGEIALNRKAALNALDYDMASKIKEGLEKWKKDPKIKLIFLHSQIHKAFSTGGDIKYLYYKIAAAEKENRDPVPDVQPFFEMEYPVNYIMRTYPKPIVVWGEGLVMGGGFGLLTAASHPIVTETSMLAMPEIKIGFFPDVGGSWFFSRLPQDMGWYLGLTGSFFNSHEFLYLKMGELYCKNSDKKALFQFLLSDSSTDKQKLTEELKLKFSYSIYPENRLKLLEKNIQSLIEKKDIKSIYEKMLSLPETNAFWKKNKEAFLQGSPTSLGVLCEQLKRGKNKTLKEVFQMEMKMALQFVRQGNFKEGIRALLIDKTKDPQWNPDSVEKLNPDWVETHFEPPSNDWKNPLEAL